MGLASALLCLTVPVFGGQQPEPKIGDTIPEIQFLDIRYLPRNLADFGPQKAFVVIFTTCDCPLVQRYLPRLARMEREFRNQGAQFLALNVGRHDTLLEVAGQALEHQVAFPVGKDFDGAAVRALGVKRTPEVVVLDRQRKLRYRGRIDQQYRLGGVRPDPGRESLREAIEAVLAGNPVPVAETPVEGCRITLAPAPDTGQAPTYAEHLAPLLEKHCVACHGATGNAPFRLDDLDQAQTFAEMMAEVVEQERMPPWYAHPDHGEFVNDRRLKAEEKRMFVEWAAAGAPAGDLKLWQAPNRPETQNWQIKPPDLVLTLPRPLRVPEEGYVPYQYVVLPHRFLQDTWLQGIQIRPQNPRIVHHANLAWFRLGEDYRASNFITGYVPGGDVMDLRDGVAYRIPQNAALILQVHLVTTGRREESQIEVGLRYAKEPVQKQLRHFQIANYRFKIPPFDGAFPVRASRRFRNDATGLGMFAHMHLRGKDMSYRAIYPDGRSQWLLKIPNYNFDWQMAYRWAPGTMRFPAGTKVEVLAHFDNSTFNPYNPDPSQEVGFGLQTDMEMMYGFLFFTEDQEALNLSVDPKTGWVQSSAKQEF
ncbi:MAG: alkyl hydroperoxide reductase [Planctomycetota bacterium]|nr:MAG: alkyl hydroperoxide reductase [Planctomycetota bacterium]